MSNARIASPIRWAVATGAVVVLAATATVATAGNGPAPKTLTYRLGAGYDAPAGPATAAPGATTFKVTTANEQGGTWQLLKVADGRDPREVAVSLDAARDPDAVEALDATLVVGASPVPGRPVRVTTTLTAGDYLVADTTGDTATPSRVLHVEGAPTGASAPKPVSTVTMGDYTYKLSRTLPRNGVVRFKNAGTRTHMAVVLKTRNAADQRKLVGLLRKNDQEGAGKLIAGDGPGVDLMAGGQSADVPVKYAKGTYVMVCFWASKGSQDKPHNVIGMEKAFTVK